MDQGHLIQLQAIPVTVLVRAEQHGLDEMTAVLAHAYPIAMARVLSDVPWHACAQRSSDRALIRVLCEKKPLRG